MSSILYYSNYCNNCSILLQFIAKSNCKDDMHFINIDNRCKKYEDVDAELIMSKEI